MESKSSEAAVRPLSKDCQFRMGMRKLWEDHIIWTLSVIVSAVGDMEGLQSDVTRLMKNQEGIGNAIKPYYGNEVGDALIKLLKTHISGAYDVLVAAKTGSKEKLDTAIFAWYANADVRLSLQRRWPAIRPESAMVKTETAGAQGFKTVYIPAAYHPSTSVMLTLPRTQTLGWTHGTV